MTVWRGSLAIALVCVAAAVAALPCGCRRSIGTSETSEENASYSLESGGMRRTYLLHVPPSYDGSKPYPLVIGFRGHGGQGANQKKMSGMDAVADRDGFLVAYPDGLDRGWNDGRGINEGIDDVGFTRDMVSEIKSEYRINPEMIYATGISNGGFMSFRLACEAPDLVAGIAPVAALMSVPLEESNTSTTPVSVLLVNGTDDPLVPWKGGEIGGRLGERGEGLSTQATIDYWVALDGCSTTPVVTKLPDSDPGDWTTATQSSYTGGREGTEVTLCAVNGGGHTWPGGQQYLSRRIIGLVSRDFNASEYIWEFFQEHPKP